MTAVMNQFCCLKPRNCVLQSRTVFNLKKPTSSRLTMLFTAAVFVAFFIELFCQGGSSVWNSLSQDFTYRGELLSGSEVCVGLAPLHLMSEITAHATQKAVTKRNFLIKLFSLKQEKYFLVFLGCLLDMKSESAQFDFI